MIYARFDFFKEGDKPEVVTTILFFFPFFETFLFFSLNAV